MRLDDYMPFVGISFWLKDKWYEGHGFVSFPYSDLENKKFKWALHYGDFNVLTVGIYNYTSPGIYHKSYKEIPTVEEIYIQYKTIHKIICQIG